jgi:formylglycine-generating enzyme required for sulfatase activity
LTAILRINGFEGGRDLSNPELPLAIGVSHDESLLFGTLAEPTVVAWLGDKEGEIFLQPVAGPSPVQLNGNTLEESAWLAAGDTIGIGRQVIRVASTAGALVLSPVEAESTHLTGNPAVSAMEGPGKGSSAEPNITPVRPIGPVRERNTRGLKALFALFALLLVGVVFVIAAAPVRVTVTPKPDSVSLSGFWPAIPFVGRYLALPGTYWVRAEKTGYRKFEQQIDVEFGSELEIHFKLIELPGYLEVISHPVASAAVFIDGKEMGLTPLKSLEVEAGRRELRVVADRYLPFKETIEVRGKGNSQSKEITLLPGWGTLEIASEPRGAEVLLNGTGIGVTPLRVEPMDGNHRIELRKNGWKPVSSDVRVKANETVKLPLFQLEKVDGVLNLTTSPPGAAVTVNGVLRGPSPIMLALKSGQDHKVSVDKAGFETVSRTVRLDGDNPKSLEIELTAQYGIVFLNTRPAGAMLKVDGMDAGSASQRLRLTTAPHQLEITKSGYKTHSVTVTPRRKISKSLEVRLEKIRSAQSKVMANETKTAAGQILRLIQLSKPTQFRLGASRREAGRRSNETQYTVELTRSFFMSEKEVTNKEFRRFKAQHDSGTEKGVSLNEPDQPVVSVPWDDAARYMNWLSEKDGLPPAYREKAGKMVAVTPMTTGYRLPTEAEWAFAARYEGGHRPTDKPLKYQWGGRMPPPNKSGNYADDTASNHLPVIIRGFSDGYLFAAPVGQFPPNKAGLFDLSGNVAEWIHDYYYVYTGGSKQVLRDPMGPKTGDLHGVRGASWRHGGITQLRLSYRDYTLKPRNDVGFRVARYATESPK